MLDFKTSMPVLLPQTEGWKDSSCWKATPNEQAIASEPTFGFFPFEAAAAPLNDVAVEYDIHLMPTFVAAAAIILRNVCC